MIDIDALEEKFAIEGELGFVEQEDDLVFISVYNKFADAEISLYGGHVTRFTPHGTFDVLWLGPASEFQVGKPIRGGIPICFPWFGPHPVNTDFPAHGFARIVFWDVIETAALQSGETKIVLQLNSNEETLKLWPHKFTAKLEIVVGKQLEVNFSVSNTDSQKISYTNALHTYYNVSEIENISIDGLQNKQYRFGTDMQLQEQTDNSLKICKEENRRYVETEGDCTLLDPVFMRTIKAGKMGSQSTVVWNPWIETCKAVPDLLDDDYQTFVCIEAANIYDAAIELNPGESQTTSVIISVEQVRNSLSRDSNDGGFSIV